MSRTTCLIVLAIAAVVVTSLQPRAQEAQRQIVFGARHAIALRSNGDVLTWGDNVMCQLGRRGGTRGGTPELMLRNGTQVAAAAEHSLALTEGGHVYGWGMNAEGWLGVGNEYDQCEGPTLVTSLEGKSIVQIATGNNFSVALSSSGELYCAGDNSVMQCPHLKGEAAEIFARALVAGLPSRLVAVKAGGFHTLALTADGRLFAFGRGRNGQLGNGRDVNGAGMVQELTDVVSFSAGIWHSAAVRRDGSVWLWGDNSRGQLCDATKTNRNVPTRLAALTSKAARVSAGGHTTMIQTEDGAIYMCGDNLSGALGVDHAGIVSAPTRVVTPAIKTTVIAAGGNHSAVSEDGCAVRIAGEATHGVAAPGDGVATIKAFTPRANLTLCGTRPASPLPDVVNPAPKGGASGCWTPRVEEDATASAKFAGLRQAMVAAESILKKNQAFLAALEPVRLRTSMSAGPMDDSGARMHIQAVPERKLDGTRLWTGECGVIPQVDRIGGAISHISVFFNADPRTQFVNTAGQPPERTGTVAGYPEFNNWIVITRDGRLPWIPQTLADRLDLEGAKRERALADWQKRVASTKPMDEAAAQKTYDVLKKTDPAGAEKFLAAMREQAREVERQQRDVYPAQTAALEKQLRDYQAYRASFTQEQLRAPAVWDDRTGDAKRQLDAKIAQLRTLPPAVQKEIDAFSRAGRAADARAARQHHMEKVAPLIAEANAQYDLQNVKPGPAEQAIAVKPDPSFPDRRDPNRIQLITISFPMDPNAKNTARRAWQQRVKETFDYAALAALLK